MYIKVYCILKCAITVGQSVLYAEYIIKYV